MEKICRVIVSCVEFCGRGVVKWLLLSVFTVAIAAAHVVMYLLKHDSPNAPSALFTLVFHTAMAVVAIALVLAYEKCVKPAAMKSKHRN